MPQLFPILFKMIFLLILSFTVVLLLKFHYQVEDGNVFVKKEMEFKSKNVEFPW